MKKIITIFLLLYAMNFRGQEHSVDSTFLDRTEFKIGYSGNIFWNQGINIGAETLWKERIKIKEKKKRSKTINKQLLFNGNIGVNTNFTIKTENGLHTYYGLIWRRTNENRWQLNMELNPLGYYRSVLPETFEVKGDEVSKVKFPGRSYYAPSMAIGIGRLRKDKTRSGWYLNLNFDFKTPFNSGTLPMVSLQYGYRFNFKK